LLAAVHIELTTTRQAALQLEPLALSPSIVPAAANTRPQPLPARVSETDRNAHRAFVATLGSEAVWRDYFMAPGVPPAGWGKRCSHPSRLNSRVRRP
jgi:DNA polymerase III subunit epsilon